MWPTLPLHLHGCLLGGGQASRMSSCTWFQRLLPDAQAPESSRVPELVGLQATQRLLQEISCGGVMDQTHQVLILPPAHPPMHILQSADCCGPAHLVLAGVCLTLLLGCTM